MIRGWLAYAVTLLCGGAFYLLYPGYLSFYTLALLLVLPLLSLLLALLELRRFRVTAEASQTSAVRGEDVSLSFCLHAPAGCRVRLTWQLEDLLYPQTRQRQVHTLFSGEPLSVALPTGHCGWVRSTPLGCRAGDLMGLFSLPVALPPEVLVLVNPQRGALPAGVSDAKEAGLALRPRPGGGPGEEYELRPYRPGDPVNAIHWKLTSKRPDGEPVLRQTMDPARRRLAVRYDHFGPPEDLDRVLDQLRTLAEWLLDKGIPFTVCRADPSTGAVTCDEIHCQAAWESCYSAIAALPAPESGAGLPPAPTLPGGEGPVKWIALTPQSGGEAAHW